MTYQGDNRKSNYVNGRAQPWEGPKGGGGERRLERLSHYAQWACSSMGRTQGGDGEMRGEKEGVEGRSSQKEG